MAEAAAPMAAGSSIFGALTSIAGGNSASAASKVQQAAYNQAAGQNRAVSQRQAEEARRQARLVQSRQQAVAAASGAGAADPTVVNLMGEARKAGEMDALTALYQGEQSARDLEYAGTLARFKGKQAKQAGYLNAFSQVLAGAGTLADAFGGALFGGAAPSGTLAKTSGRIPGAQGSYRLPNMSLRGPGGTLGGGV